MIEALYFFMSVIVICILSFATTVPDTCIISIAILLAGWDISSAIIEKKKK